jgi:hypothetical protein
MKNNNKTKQILVGTAQITWQNIDIKYLEHLSEAVSKPLLNQKGSIRLTRPIGWCMEFGGGFATGGILCNIGGVGRGV